MTVIDEIRAERQRQIEVKGFTAEHDDNHSDGSLAFAAAAYAAYPNIDMEYRENDISGGRGETPVVDGAYVPQCWPESWSVRWWKPETHRRDLIKAAALIIADIERIDRAAAKGLPMTHDPRVETACKAYTEKENSLPGVNLSWPDDYLYDCLDGIIREAMTAALAAADAADPPEPVYKAVERILDDNSAWIARPNDRVTREIALAVTMSAMQQMLVESRTIVELYEALGCDFDKESAIQAIAKLKRDSQWRDIKDAPRDGRPIIIAWFYNSEWLFSTVRWDADFGIWEDDSGLEYEEFLLWAPVPLPSSPEAV